MNGNRGRNGKNRTRTSGSQIRSILLNRSARWPSFHHPHKTTCAAATQGANERPYTTTKPISDWWHGTEELNPEPADLESAALPIELVPCARFVRRILACESGVVKGQRRGAGPVAHTETPHATRHGGRTAVRPYRPNCPTIRYTVCIGREATNQLVMTLQEKIASWAAGFRLGDAPPRILTAARGQMLSVLAGTLASASSAEGKAVIRAAHAWPTGRSLLLTPARNLFLDRTAAAAANAALSCTYDYDDYMLLGHGGHSAVHVPLALGTENSKSIGEVFAAQILANEVAGRLGLSCFFGPQNGQQLPFIHQVGAAVAAGYLTGSTPKELANALGIALSQPPAPLWPAFLGGFGSKILVPFEPVAAGIRAAELAKSGLTAPLDLLDHPGGFYSRFSFLPLPQVIGGFSWTWVLDSLHIKTYPTCAYHLTTHALVDRFRNKYGQGIFGDLKSATIHTTALATIVSHLADTRDHGVVTANEANFSLTTGPALSMLMGGFSPSYLDDDLLREQSTDIRALAKRITLLHDLDMTVGLVQSVNDKLDIRCVLGNLPLHRVIKPLLKAWLSMPGMSASKGLRGSISAYQAAKVVRRILATRAQGGTYSLGEHPFVGLRLPFASRLTITTRDGTTVTETLTTPPGSVCDADFLDLAREKFMRASHFLKPERREAIVEFVLAAPMDTPVRKLVELFACP